MSWPRLLICSRIGARAKGEAVFGVAWGSVYGSIASTWGASCAFLVGPCLARDANARKIDSNQRYTAIDCAVVAEGWKIVGLTGLSPIFPLTLLNYAYGRILVKFSQWVLASWTGLMGEAIDCDFNQMHQDAVFNGHPLFLWEVAHARLDGWTIQTAFIVWPESWGSGAVAPGPWAKDPPQPSQALS